MFPAQNLELLFNEIGINKMGGKCRIGAFFNAADYY